ncbi:hypothetical protein RvY_08973 [Ramazzottius varieornatus]|uniref:SP-RING-type domain-containing protein n=1 Tax=Ramazzottius varieornatus TaxID=947166 RepID=A0A1D1V7S6_RAMVA|nr:hypothetical protein RvY_08973 [Ramazzottius varieornatus]
MDTIELVLNSLLGPNKDIEPLDKISLSLTCPITYTKMKVACKGSRCRHATCFEGASFLQMHQQSGEPRWKCAVCKEIVHWYNLRSDELMQYLIEQFPDCDKVEAKLQDGVLSFHGIPADPDVDDDEDGMD